ncbi:hypothetical protein AB0J43_27810, partial [Nonomuraea fuscirosea]
MTTLSTSRPSTAAARFSTVTVSSRPLASGVTPAACGESRTFGRSRSAAIVYMSIPSTSKQLLPDIRTVMNQIRLNTQS